MAGPLSFDDLVPSAASSQPVGGAAPAAGAGVLSFDDLVPQKAASADDDPYTRAPATWSDTKTALGKALDLNVAAANGVTMGAAPKLGALAGSDPVGKWLGTAGPNTPTYDQALADREATLKRVQAENPTGAKVAQTGGNLLTLLAGGGVAGAGADALAGIPVLGRVAASPLVQAAAVSSAANAGEAASSGQPVLPAAAQGAAVGAGGSALGGALSRGVGAIGGLFAERPQIISPEDLGQAAQNAYGRAWAAGVGYSPQAMRRLGDTVEGHMDDFGFAPELQPGGTAVIRTIRGLDNTPAPAPEPPPLNSITDPAARAAEFQRRINAPPAPEPEVAPASLQDVDIARRIAGRMYETNPSSGLLGGNIRGIIDDFTANPRPGDIMMGDADGGVQALTDARRLYNMSSKDQDLADALDAARIQAARAGSGGNINNATRQQVSKVMQGRGDWTPDELAALNTAVEGTRFANTARQAGKLSPEGNGLMTALNIGSIMAEPHSVAIPIVGAVAKRFGDEATARAVDHARQIIRAGGNAAAIQPAPTLVQQLAAQAGQPISTGVTLGSLYGGQ